MAIDIVTPSRRGFLGLFGSAAAAAAMAAPAVHPAQPEDWRTKPVANWTQADFIAEAEYELAEHTKKAKEVFRSGMSWHEQQLYRAHLEFKSWWQLELWERQGRFA